MPHADLIIHNAGQLVTCASDGVAKRGAAMQDVGLIKNGAVAVADGRIIGVGPSDVIEREFEAADMIDAAGRVVCPGFVDPHTHIVFAGDRLNEFELKIKGAEYLEILKNGGGIISTVRHTREASVGTLYEQSCNRLDKMLACGTTTCEIKTGYGLDAATEMKMLDVIAGLDQSHCMTIVPTLLAAHAIPPEFTGDADGYVNLVCETILPLAWRWYEQSHFAQQITPFFCDVFTELNAFSLEQSVRILEAARHCGLGTKAHVGQFSDLGGSSAAMQLEAVSIDHLDFISDQDIRTLATIDTVGVLIPTENFNAGKTRFADARRLIDAGCSVALSTDYNPGSAPCPSQPMAMAIACRYQKLLPSEAFNAATVNAAHAIGMQETCGSIEPGKSADLLIFDCTDYRQIAYEFGGNLVSTVIKSGNVVSGSSR